MAFSIFKKPKWQNLSIFLALLCKLFLEVKTAKWEILYNNKMYNFSRKVPKEFIFD